MRIRWVDRTATVAWSPGQHSPLLALGTIAGALDASFSTNTELEIFDLNISSSSTQLPSFGPHEPTRGNLRRVGAVSTTARFNRLVWGGYDAGSKPYGILAGGLDNGELHFWDPQLMLDPAQADSSMFLKQTTHSGPVRGLDFNPQSTNLLASGATDGEIYIWDLANPSTPYSPGARSQRIEDVTALAWNRRIVPILATASNNGYTVVWDLRKKNEIVQLPHPGGRRPVTSIAWHPDEPLKMVTASDDDMNPQIIVWDLRNAHAPERVLSGHHKGILSVAWCAKDADMLLSGSKDSKSMLWNPSDGSLLGEVDEASKWVFDVQWCPRNPDLFCVASFDGKVSVHSLQGAGVEDEPADEVHASPAAPSDDPFAQVERNFRTQQKSSGSAFVLSKPPKWFRRPAGATFGFGGRLVSFANLGPGGKRFVSVRTIHAEPSFARRVSELEAIVQDGNVDGFMKYCLQMSTSDGIDEKERQLWKFLGLMFDTESRERIIEFLGFDRSKVAGDSLAHVLKKLKLNEPAPVEAETKEANGNGSLFGPGGDATTQFDSLPHIEPTKPFKLYPGVGKGSDEADKDAIITRAVLLGDYDTAVSVCLASERYADALILALSGGAELLASTQAAYFKKMNEKKSYLRVLQNILKGDLLDVVQKAEVDGIEAEGGWKDVLALICTYGKAEDFSALTKALGQRLDRGKIAGGPLERAFAAILCYLGAGDVEKVVDIWTRAEADEESRRKTKATAYAAHVHAVQSLIEKVTVFRKAISYVDPDLPAAAENSYALKKLYEQYADYAVWAAAEGFGEAAWRVLELIPAGFKIRDGDDIAVLRHRVFKSAGLANRGFREPTLPFDIVDITPNVQAAPTAQQQYYAQTTYNNPATRYSGYGTAPAAAAQPAASAAYGGYNTGTYGAYANTSYGATTAAGVYSTGATNAYTSPTPAPTYPSGVTPNPAVPSYSTGAGAGYANTGYASNTSTNYAQSAYGGVYGAQAQAGYGGYGYQPSASPAPAEPAGSSFQSRAPDAGFNDPPMNIVPRGRLTPRVSAAAPPQPTFQPAGGPPSGNIASGGVPPPYGRPPSTAPYGSPGMGAVVPPGGPRFGPGGMPPSPAPAPVTTPAPPETSRHPPGDRSHIPAAQKPIVDGLEKLLAQAKLIFLAQGPAQRKAYEDAEKKIHSLFDALNNAEGKPEVIELTLELVKALERKDSAGSHKILVDLMNKYEPWMTGVKRLIENIERAASGAAVAYATPSPPPHMGGAYAGGPPPTGFARNGGPPPAGYGAPPPVTGPYGGQPGYGAPQAGYAGGPPPQGPPMTGYQGGPPASGYGAPPPQGFRSGPPPMGGYGEQPQARGYGYQ
ncbi:hypothetical protein BJ742DRAFT_795709 [Cladochytrium replicatum]|nr:hypothetical protein BJ742DRAFT_795709 [Cladochytrium replicatum]